MKRTLGLGLLLLGCTRDNTAASVSLAPPSGGTSAAPVVAAHPLGSSSAPDVEIAHGVVVDLRARREVRTLVADDDVWNGADDGTRAYEHIRADGIKRTDEEVRAYDTRSGALVWTQKVGRCYAMAAGPAGLFCDSNKNGEIVLLDRATGSQRSLPLGGAYDVSSIARVGSKIAAFSSFGTTVPLFDAATGAPAGTATVPQGFHLARVRNGTACGIGIGNASFTVQCFDPTPRVLWSKTYPFADAELRMTDDHDALVTSRMWYGTKPKESVVVSLDDGHVVTRFAGFASCLVRDPDGKLVGLLRAAPKAAYLDLAGAERWQTSEVHDDSAAALVVDGTLVVASFGRITTGAELVGLDVTTGALRWRGDVQLLPIAHSVYSNEVDLRLVNHAIVMRGREAMLDYLEIFAPTDGKRLYATVRAR